MIREDYPLSSTDMLYDNEEHMYIMQPRYITTKTGVDLTLTINDAYVVDKNVAVKSLLSDISGQIYNYIYSYNFDNDYQEWLLAKSEMAREIIRKAILLQLGYVMGNGKINEFAGLQIDNPGQGGKIDLEDLRGNRAIHPEAIQLLKRTLETGDRLLYNGQYSYDNKTFRTDY